MFDEQLAILVLGYHRVLFFVLFVGDYLLLAHLRLLVDWTNVGDYY